MVFWTNLFTPKKQRLAEYKARLTADKNNQLNINKEKLNEKEDTIPLVKANNILRQTLKRFENKRNLLALQWRKAYENFSWWDKLKHDEELDLSNLDNQIKTLKIALSDFEQSHLENVKKLQVHFFKLKYLTSQRIEIAYQIALQELEKGSIREPNKSLLIAGWLATLTIPISILNDVNSADQVYAALRSVNSNFEGLSNSEIWWETLWMSPESYAGLTSLTKGAYFESLVAQNTGGELKEHFNHPETDISINGVEIQLKATDSVTYINSVDDDIPVFATSEVTLNTDAADSGFSNEDMTNMVEQALGGTVIDVNDTTVDTILTGVGTLGVFATMHGINHASQRYENGVAGVEAIFEGAGVAIAGTAKGLVDASEMVFNVAMSRPSRFVSRTLAKGFVKLDESLFGTDYISKERKK
jgi:hypothetical protein